MRPRCSVSCSFLQFSSLFGPKVPRVYLLGSRWIFYQRKVGCVYSRKPSNRIGYSGVFCDILRLFESYSRKRARIWLKAYGMIVLVKFCKKIQSPYPSPVKFFSFSFFFQKIDAWLNEIRRTKKSSTSRSIDFTHVKLKTRSMPFTMYVREFGAAWLNPDLRPFAGRAPVKSKCMGFAGYLARCTFFAAHLTESSLREELACGPVIEFESRSWKVPLGLQSHSICCAKNTTPTGPWGCSAACQKGACQKSKVENLQSKKWASNYTYSVSRLVKPPKVLPLTLLSVL